MPDLDQIRPSLSRRIAQQVSDLAGGVAYGGGVESTNVAFGGPTADFILYGVVNGAFAQGPPNAADYIDPQNNPMPYWSGPTQALGGAWQCSWVADASSPSGQNLRFTMNPGAASDEAYMEQITPIGGDRFGFLAITVWLTYSIVSVSGSGPTMKLSTDFLKADGITTTGSTGSSSGGTVSTTPSVRYASNFFGASIQVPTDAAYKRIRIGLARGVAAAADSAVIDMVDVRIQRSTPFTIINEVDDPTTYGAGAIATRSGDLTIYAPTTAGGTISDRAVLINTASGVRVLSNLTTSNSLTVGKAVIESGIITDTIAADKNNYSPTGLATCATLVTTVTGATRTVTGFDATGFVDGQEFTIINDNTNQLTFAHSSASSSSGNRIGCPGAASKTISTNGSATFSYQSANFPVAPFRMISAL